MRKKYLHNPLVPFTYNKKLLSKSTDVRIYSDVILLTPGEYSDSISSYPVVYTKDELKKSATNWEENYLNLDHSFETLKRIGFVNNPRFQDNALMGDLYIYPITRNAKDTIALIDAGLVNWLSIELKSEDVWNSADSKKYAKDIVFIGAAVVLYPACEDTRIIQ